MGQYRTRRAPSGMGKIQVLIWCSALLAAVQGSVSTSKSVVPYLNSAKQIPVRVVLDDNKVTHGHSNVQDIRHFSCPLFEEYLNCGPTCDITCASLGKACPPGPCQSGCFCEPGKVRSTKTGKCVSQKYCSSKLH